MTPAIGVAEPILEIDGLKTWLRAADGGFRPILNGVSLSVGANETLAIVGESGSGKSILSLSVMGLLPARSARVEGSIRLCGTELTTMSPAQMRAIRGNAMAMVFQEPMTSLNPLLTIGQQIAEVLMLHRGLGHADARKETLQLLEKVRIPGAAARFDEYPHRFSGGMRQRAMIAMALACRPRLLIADEPTTALDVTIQAQILDLIREMQRESGMGVLFITHDMGVVAEMADRTAVIRQGDLLEVDTTGRVFRNPRHDYTRWLLAAVPRLGAMQGKTAPERFALSPNAAELPAPVAVPSPAPAASASGPQTRALPVLAVQELITRFPLVGGFLGRATAVVHAVEGISFDLMPGETLAIVGESGSGKSSVARSILRLVETQGGSVQIGGQDVLKMGPARLRVARRDIQMIFQDPFSSLDPRMRVGAQIAEPILTHGLLARDAARRRVGELLEQVGLTPEMALRFPHEFSGGQRQRICIARALALEPRVIIADEAVSALDASIKAQIVNLMLDLQERLGVAFLFISHDMAVVERISHRVAVMLLGEIVEIGPRSAVFENPSHPYTRKLLAAVPRADPQLAGTRQRPPVEEIRSAVRPPGYVPPVRRYREVAPGHRVMLDD